MFALRIHFSVIPILLSFPRRRESIFISCHCEGDKGPGAPGRQSLSYERSVIPAFSYYFHASKNPIDR